MLEIFREFFNDQDINFNELDPSTLIVFDTNTLLNIYRYSDETRKKLIDAMESVQQNLWIPYQVGLEFNLRRKKTLYDLKNQPSKKNNDIIKIFNDFEKKITNEIQSITLKSSDVIEQKNLIISDTKEKLKTLQDEMSSSIEKIFNMLNLEEDLAINFGTIFKDKIGASFSQEELTNELSDAKMRYENKIPPGYSDLKKEDVTHYNGINFNQKYGDLIIWKQILKRAEESDITQVIFITDDNKEDWWYKLHGESLGPRAELKNEMLRLAKADLFMFNSNSFLNKISNEIQDLISTSEISDFNFEDFEWENYISKSNSKLEDIQSHKNNKNSSLIDFLISTKHTKFLTLHSLNEQIELMEEQQEKPIEFDEFIENLNIIEYLNSERNKVEMEINDLNDRIDEIKNDN